MRGFILYDKAGLKRNFKFSEMMGEYAHKCGITLKTVLREELLPAMEGSELVIYKENEKISPPDFIINRCIDPFFAIFLESMGIPLFNSAEICRVCNDKRLTHIYFSGRGIPMADSFFINKFNTQRPETYPYILKTPDGHGGEEVFFISSKADEHSHSYTDLLCQKPAATKGRDLRVYVMNKKILAAVLRSSDKDFRSNFSLGGRAELYTLSKEERELVNKVISALPSGALYVGIDFIFDGEKMLLNEIEDIVGSRMLYEKTDIPVHELLVDSIINKLGKNDNKH